MMKTKMILLMTSVILTSPALAAVTPISGQVGSVRAFAQIFPQVVGPDPVVVDFSTSSVANWTTLQPGTTFNASSIAKVEYGGVVAPYASATSYRSFAASWESATSGQVKGAWGWEGTGAYMEKWATPSTNEPFWSYAFKLTTPAELTLNAVRQSTSSNGALNDLNKFHLLKVSNSVAPISFDQDGTLPFSSVDLSVMLSPGEYNLQLWGLSSHQGFYTNYSADSTLDVNWAITSMPTNTVPEPASWAMLIAGFGLTGAAMRRRNAAVRPRRMAA
jgi:hypothetical protein